MSDLGRPAIMRGTDFNGNTNMVEARLPSSEGVTGAFSNGSSDDFSVVVNLVVGASVISVGADDVVVSR